MTTMIDGAALLKVLLGFVIPRALATLPQTTATAYFTIAGGRVVMTSILGEVTTVIETAANNAKLTANPTTGTAVDVCAVLDITADEVGCLYGITGTIADALIGTNAGTVQRQAVDVFLPVGTLDFDCAASKTGATKWALTYIPLDDGASVVAA